MTKIILTNLVGSYPLRVYVSDIYGGNESFLGQINTSFTGSTEYNLPIVFDNAPQVTIKIIDSNNMVDPEKLKIYSNRHGVDYKTLLSLAAIKPKDN